MINNRDMSGKYDDIINLPHHQSSRRPPMSLQSRAAQFSPFAALTGYEAAIEEAGRLTEQFREQDESAKAVLDAKLQILQEQRERRPEVSILHFVPDLVKEGGRYVETAGNFLKVDDKARVIVLEQGKKIELDRIADICSDLFGEA